MAPAPPSTSVELVNVLRRENDRLRAELQREREYIATLERALGTTRAGRRATSVGSVPAEVRAAGALPSVQPEKDSSELCAVRQRCSLLAHHLRLAVQRRHVAESSEVYLLLRSQQEERHNLSEALEEWLEHLSVEDAVSREARHRRMYASQSAHEPGPLHTGTLYALVRLVAEGLQFRLGEVKLEKARARLCLEHALTRAQEMHTAMEKALQVAFGCYTELTTAVTDSFPGPSACYPPPPACVEWAGAGRTISVKGATASTPAHRHPHTLAADLWWSCDVLKACLRGWTELQTWLVSGCRELVAPPATVYASSEAVSPTGERAGRDSLLDSLESGRLFDGFLQDMRRAAVRSAESHERLSRRLSREIQCHHTSIREHRRQVESMQADMARVLRVISVGETAPTSVRGDATVDTTSHAFSKTPSREMPERPGGLDDAHPPPLRAEPPREDDMLFPPPCGSPDRVPDSGIGRPPARASPHDRRHRSPEGPWRGHDGWGDPDRRVRSAPRDPWEGHAAWPVPSRRSGDSEEVSPSSAGEETTGWGTPSERCVGTRTRTAVRTSPRTPWTASTGEETSDSRGGRRSGGEPEEGPTRRSSPSEICPTETGERAAVSAVSAQLSSGSPGEPSTRLTKDEAVARVVEAVARGGRVCVETAETAVEREAQGGRSPSGGPSSGRPPVPLPFHHGDRSPLCSPLP